MLGDQVKMVEPAGFELATPWSQTKCATSCATARHFNESLTLTKNTRLGKVIFAHREPFGENASSPSSERLNKLEPFHRA